MAIRSPRKILYYSLRVVQGLSVVTSASITTLAKSDPTSFRGFESTAHVFIEFSKSHLWMAAVLTVLVGIVELFAKWTGAPWVWELIKFTINEMREHAFPSPTVVLAASAPPNPKHHHRVTLFKYVKFHFCMRKWPWSGWLVPIVRSGDTTQKISVIFKAPDKADDVEGVAGQTWSCDTIIRISGLPDITNHPDTAKLTEYADKAWVTVDWLKKHNSPARSFLGVPIKAKGKIWGVLIVDSRLESIDNVEQIISSYKLIAKVLEKLVERA